MSDKFYFFTDKHAACIFVHPCNFGYDFSAFFHIDHISDM